MYVQGVTPTILLALVFGGEKMKKILPLSPSDPVTHPTASHFTNSHHIRTWNLWFTLLF